jgi:hypothetical protein
MQSEGSGLANQVTDQFVQWAHFLQLMASTRLGMRYLIMTGTYCAASVTRSPLGAMGTE